MDRETIVSSDVSISLHRIQLPAGNGIEEVHRRFIE
jgi:hypothetical protein